MTLREFALLSDENVDSSVTAFLRARGFDVFDVREAGLKGTDDARLLQQAADENRVIITHDRDFGRLAVAESRPFVGIVYLRPGHIQPEFTIRSLQALLDAEIDLVTPFLIVVHQARGRIRIRVRMPSA